MVVTEQASVGIPGRTRYRTLQPRNVVAGAASVIAKFPDFLLAGRAFQCGNDADPATVASFPVKIVLRRLHDIRQGKANQGYKAKQRTREFHFIPLQKLFRNSL